MIIRQLSARNTDLISLQWSYLMSTRRQFITLWDKVTPYHGAYSVFPWALHLQYDDYTFTKFRSREVFKRDLQIKSAKQRQNVFFNFVNFKITGVGVHIHGNKPNFGCTQLHCGGSCSIRLVWWRLSHLWSWRRHSRYCWRQQWWVLLIPNSSHWNKREDELETWIVWKVILIGIVFKIRSKKSDTLKCE